MAIIRKYPAGIQSFETIRTDGYVYVDKTAYIYKLMSTGMTYFLSRPRRFGKSLLVSTLAALFEGKRELFEAFTTKDGIEQPALYISTTDWEWEKYPVLRFDFSQVGKNEEDSINEYIDRILTIYEKTYSINNSLKTQSNRLSEIIQTAHAVTGKKAVVLVDEYDNQILKSIGNPAKEAAIRETFMGLFAPLKGLDEHLRFVFITGISKFSQMGIFSQLNNLNNISMQPDYDCICGISEEELTSSLADDIRLLAERRSENYDETLASLKKRYDGYHFSHMMTDIYNPFSVVKALHSAELSDYWFDSATPRALIDMLSQMPPLELPMIENVECMSSEFDIPFDSYNAPLPALYQSGYLTIKDFDRDEEVFTLGFPNEEVRRGFANILYKHVSGRAGKDDPDLSVFFKAYRHFRRTDDLPAFIEAIKTFYSGIPYHLENHNERHYHAILYTLLSAFGADLNAEEPSAKGRADIILRMPLGIYVIEIKYDGTADEALQQIRDKGYANKYRLDGRHVTCVGINFSSKERNITEWKSYNIN